MNIEMTKLVPHPEITIFGGDPESYAIENYLRKTEYTPDINVKYSCCLTDNIDNVATLVETSKHRKDGINEVRNLLGQVQHDGGNFRKVYAEIIFITHLLLVLNRELRGKHKKLPKIVKQAISLYEEINKDNAEIYWAHRDSILDLQVARWVSFICFAIIIALIMCLAVMAILLGANY